MVRAVAAARQDRQRGGFTDQRRGSGAILPAAAAAVAWLTQGVGEDVDGAPTTANRKTSTDSKKHRRLRTTMRAVGCSLGWGFLRVARANAECARRIGNSGKVKPSGGECEIRTHGRFHVGSFQDCWFKPLTQLSRFHSRRLRRAGRQRGRDSIRWPPTHPRRGHWTRPRFANRTTTRPQAPSRASPGPRSPRPRRAVPRRPAAWR
jgi:hypothetical protein